MVEKENLLLKALQPIMYSYVSNGEVNQSRRNKINKNKTRKIMKSQKTSYK